MWYSFKGDSFPLKSPSCLGTFSGRLDMLYIVVAHDCNPSTQEVEAEK